MGSRTIFAPRQNLFFRTLRRVRLFYACLIPLILSIVLLVLIRVLPAQSIEAVYSQNIFRKISAVCGLASRHLPFSLGGVLLWGLAGAAVLAVLVPPVLLMLLPGLRRSKLPTLWARAMAALLALGLLALAVIFAPPWIALLLTPVLLLATLLCAPKLSALLALILLLFTVTCAPNYYRLTFAEQSGLVIRNSHVSELEALCGELIEKANAARELTDGADKPFAELSRQSLEAFNALEADYPFLGRARSPAKPMPFSEILSVFNLTGFYFPYTAEANVNNHMPQTEAAFTICHELAHTCGFMREDEANFIGYLACLKSPDAKLRYSGLYVATVHSMNALYRADSQRYFALREQYSPALARDMSQVQQYWDAYFDTPAAEVSNVVNDTYLKANNLSDGTQSYGRMVDLLLAQYRQAHGIT